MTSYPMKGTEGLYAAAVESMSEDEASEVADQIHSLATLLRDLWNERASPPTTD